MIKKTLTINKGILEWKFKFYPFNISLVNDLLDLYLSKLRECER